MPESNPEAVANDEDEEYVTVDDDVEPDVDAEAVERRRVVRRRFAGGGEGDGPERVLVMTGTGSVTGLEVLASCSVTFEPIGPWRAGRSTSAVYDKAVEAAGPPTG